MKHALIMVKVAIVVTFAWTVYRIYIAEQVSTIELVLSMAAILAAALISLREQRENWRRIRAAAAENWSAAQRDRRGGPRSRLPR
jgi:hypothetical protein